MRNLLKSYLINGVHYLYLDELNQDENEDKIRLAMANGFMIVKFTNEELKFADVISDEPTLTNIVTTHNKLIKSLISDKNNPSYIIDSANNVLVTHVLGKEI